jgi:hypothetical protein
VDWSWPADSRPIGECLAFAKQGSNLFSPQLTHFNRTAGYDVPFQFWGRSLLDIAVKSRLMLDFATGPGGPRGDSGPPKHFSRRTGQAR